MAFPCCFDNKTVHRLLLENKGSQIAYFSGTYFFPGREGVKNSYVLALSGDGLDCTPELRHAGRQLIRGHLGRFCLVVYL